MDGWKLPMLGVLWLWYPKVGDLNTGGSYIMVGSQGIRIHSIYSTY